jgi:hypothetical protein
MSKREEVIQMKFYLMFLIYQGACHMPTSNFRKCLSTKNCTKILVAVSLPERMNYE